MIILFVYRSVHSCTCGGCSCKLETWMLVWHLSQEIRGPIGVGICMELYWLLSQCKLLWFFVYIKSYIINYYNHTTIINYQKFEKKYYFIEQGRIKLIKMTVKKCIMLQNNFILNKCCSYELSIHQRTTPPPTHPPSQKKVPWFLQK